MSDLSLCAKILKYLILLFNFVFFIGGIALVCVGAAISLKFKFPGHFLSNAGADLSHALGSAPIGCVIAGVIVILIVSFGVVGAYKEGPCLLGLYTSLLIICCIIEFGSAGGIASWKKIDENSDVKIKEAFMGLINSYDPASEVNSKAIDTIQLLLDCCGNDGPQDWANSTTMNPVKDVTPVKYPKSCCGYESDNEAVCTKDRSELHHMGCSGKFKQMVEDNSSIIIGIGVSFGLLQLLGVVFSIALIIKIRQNSGASYKPQFNNYNH